MAGNTILNTDPAIRAVVHSDMLLKQLEDGFLPDGLVRDVSDFGDGTSLQIPTLGEMTIQDITEEQDTPLNAMDTGKINLSINQHKGGGGYVSDELKEDGYKAMEVESNIVPSTLRALKESYETDFLAQVQKQTASDPNVLANAAHRIIASGTNGTITLDDIAYLKLAADKAHVPEEGRILIVDPIFEMTLNSLVGAQAFTNNPMFEGMVGEGFAKGRKFLRNIFGWDIWCSNRLPQFDSETIAYASGIEPPIGAAGGTITSGVVNVAMCVADDMTKPIMGAWRRMPRVAGVRNESKRRDEFHVTSRWGLGVQRFETLFSILSSRVAYK